MTTGVKYISPFDVPIEPSRHYQRSGREMPCFEQGFASLVRILNHIYDVTKVDHIRGGLLAVRQMYRVPAAGLQAHAAKRRHVCAPAASKIEEAPIRSNHAVIEGEGDRSGKSNAMNCRLAARLKHL